MIVELFGGAGGASLGIHDAAPDETVIGIEWDQVACSTRAAAGLMPTICADVAQIEPDRFSDVTGVWGSPPCPSFSTAGLGAGMSMMERLSSAMVAILRGEDVRDAVRDALLAETPAAIRDSWVRNGKEFTEERLEREAAHRVAESMLVLEPARFAYELRPAWVACEQVPAVLPLWKAMAGGLAELGYATWCGLLDTANYGVAQNRVRAILMAKRDGSIGPPPATHSEASGTGLFGLPPWVSMAERLGWGMTERPGMTVTGAGRDGGGPHDGGTHARAAVERERDAGRFIDPDATVGFLRRNDRGDSSDDGTGHRARDRRRIDQPAQTVTEKGRSWVLNTGLDWKEGGSRDDAQTRSLDQPSPTVSTKSSHQWQRRDIEPDDEVVLQTGSNSMKHNRNPDDIEPYERDVDRPAPTVDTKAPGAWSLVVKATANSGARSRDIERSEDEPAPPIALGHNITSWVWDRPATVVQGDPRVFAPGGHIANDGRDNSKMIGRSEDAIRVTLAELAALQDFPMDFPFQGNRTRVAAQIGNAVPRALARAIVECLAD